MHRNSSGHPDLQAGGDDLGAVLCRIGDLATMHALLVEILTPAERSDLALRWRLMRLLHQGIPQRTIARELRISLCKITRGSRVLKQPHSVTRRILDASRSAPAVSSHRHRSPVQHRQSQRRSVHP